MLAWEERPFEVAHLLNPAFCVLLIHATLEEFIKEKGDDDGMPYPLSFIMLPLVLHKGTREALPRTISKEMANWLADNPDVVIGFPSRARLLVPFVKESIIFGMQKKAVEVASNGSLVSGVASISLPRSWPSNSEPTICYERSGFVGRWFARTGSEATIYKLWGVHP